MFVDVLCLFGFPPSHQMSSLMKVVHQTPRLNRQHYQSSDVPQVLYSGPCIDPMLNRESEGGDAMKSTSATALDTGILLSTDRIYSETSVAGAARCRGCFMGSRPHDGRMEQPMNPRWDEKTFGHLFCSCLGDSDFYVVLTV